MTRFETRFERCTRAPNATVVCKRVPAIRAKVGVNKGLKLSLLAHRKRQLQFHHGGAYVDYIPGAYRETKKKRKTFRLANKQGSTCK